mgnify:CR=1 FL=1
MNYLHIAKVHHASSGSGWPDELALAGTRFLASTTRGMVPSRQSEPLPFKKLADLDLSSRLHNPRYPVAPSCCVVLFTFFLLRELECAAAEYNDMTLDFEQQLVALKLSVSKNDPRAIGCERKWGCVCADVNSPSTSSCPYHAAESLDATLRHLFGADVLLLGFPLFPDSEGNPPFLLSACSNL